MGGKKNNKIELNIFKFFKKIKIQICVNKIKF
jgi:hypothetical protein